MEMYHGEFLTGMPQEMQDCIGNCTMTAKACSQMIQWCLKMKNMPSDMTKTIMALQCCEQMCNTFSCLMTCESKQCGECSKVCANVCMTCADECDRAAKMDKSFKLCADICRKCAES